jgi:hypothetical protein
MTNPNSNRSHFRIAICIALLALFLQTGYAQSSTASQSPSGSASRSVPTVTPTTYTPLTSEQRLHRYLRSLIGPDVWISSAFTAGLNQWTNTPGAWGQGADGYGRRFGSSFGFHVVHQSIEYGASSLLHEDNRYIRSTATGVGPRLRYALTSTVMARSPDGSRHISISSISAYAGAGFISRTWQPSSNAGAQDAISAMGISMGLTAGRNIVREFVPRVAHMWFFKKD